MEIETEVVKDLLLQSLEHERGGVTLYETALECVVNDDLRKEWEKYLDETRHHVEVLESACAAFGLDPEMPSAGREVVALIGSALVDAVLKAREAGKPEAAEIVAAECITLAETKDHLDWELIGKVAAQLKGDERRVLREAYEEIEDQEDEHLYHTKGWCRELWMKALGMPAELPPPEERKHVKTAIGAARAEQAREPSKPN